MDVAELLPDADVRALLAYTAVLLAKVATLDVWLRDVSVKVDELMINPPFVYINPFTTRGYTVTDEPIAMEPVTNKFEFAFKLPTTCVELSLL